MTKSVRQIAPQDARTVAIKYGFSKETIIFGCHANGFFAPEQKLFNPRH